MPATGAFAEPLRSNYQCRRGGTAGSDHHDDPVWSRSRSGSKTSLGSCPLGVASRQRTAGPIRMTSVADPSPEETNHETVAGRVSCTFPQLRGATFSVPALVRSCREILARFQRQIPEKRTGDLNLSRSAISFALNSLCGFAGAQRSPTTAGFLKQPQDWRGRDETCDQFSGARFLRTSGLCRISTEPGTSRGLKFFSVIVHDSEVEVLLTTPQRDQKSPRGSESG
jgi:hypothetical protein